MIEKYFLFNFVCLCVLCSRKFFCLYVINIFAVSLPLLLNNVEEKKTEDENVDITLLKSFWIWEQKENL